jgi:Methyltransferase domain
MPDWSSAVVTSGQTHAAVESLPATLERQLNGLDHDALFNHIYSETTSQDRHSLLSLHVACRQRRPFTYLEIGSHLGGSLQALVVDPLCERIISIDARPAAVSDERQGKGGTFPYEGNTTARMLGLLAAVPGADVGKIHTIDAGTDQIDRSSLPFQPDFCLVDGEHTDRAVLRDARFCLSVVNPNGCIAFHDAHVVYRGLNEFIQRDLIGQGRPFRAYALPDVVFVIQLGTSTLHESPSIRSLLENNYQPFLRSLMANDQYREIALHPAILFLRKARIAALRIPRMLGLLNE